MTDILFKAFGDMRVGDTFMHKGAIFEKIEKIDTPIDILGIKLKFNSVSGDGTAFPTWMWVEPDAIVGAVIVNKLVIYWNYFLALLKHKWYVFIAGTVKAE